MWVSSCISAHVMCMGILQHTPPQNNLLLLFIPTIIVWRPASIVDRLTTFAQSFIHSNVCVRVYVRVSVCASFIYCLFIRLILYPSFCEVYCTYTNTHTHTDQSCWGDWLCIYQPKGMIRTQVHQLQDSFVSLDSRCNSQHTKNTLS